MFDLDTAIPISVSQRSRWPTVVQPSALSNQGQAWLDCAKKKTQKR